MIHSLIVLVAAVALAGTAGADVFVVDVQKVINSSIIGKAARNNVEGLVKKSEARVGKLRSELDKLRTDIEKQGSLLSADAMSEKRKQLSRKEREVQDEVRAQREELSRAHAAEIEKVVTEIRKVVAELSESRGLGIIVEKDPRTVLYASERVDLSDEVAKVLDAKKTQL